MGSFEYDWLNRRTVSIMHSLFGKIGPQTNLAQPHWGQVATVENERDQAGSVWSTPSVDRQKEDDGRP